MNGVFAVHKPTGPTSQDVVGKLKHIFTKSKQFLAEKPTQQTGRRGRHSRFIKIGHGGTLDPLADGVLVIGIGTGTKKLAGYLGSCSKVYRATALLGCSTTSYDSEGAVLEYGDADPLSILDTQLQSVLASFRGHIKQIPPVYSALKMDGKPLYEYARENIPLPRPIEARECEISQLTAKITSKTADLPQNRASEAERKFVAKVQRDSAKDIPASGTESSGHKQGKLVELTFSVSSGTYIRSLIHDIGVALGTNAHMTKLTRVSQGEWELGKNVLPLDLFDGDWWPTLETTLKEGPRRRLEAAVSADEVGVETAEEKMELAESETMKPADTLDSSDAVKCAETTDGADTVEPLVAEDTKQEELAVFPESELK